MIRISKSFLTSLKDNTRVCSSILIDKYMYLLWYEINKEYRDFINLNTLDPFLLAVLPYAKENKQDIEVEGDISNWLFDSIKDVQVKCNVVNKMYEGKDNCSTILDDNSFYHIVYNKGKNDFTCEYEARKEFLAIKNSIQDENVIFIDNNINDVVYSNNDNIEVSLPFLFNGLFNEYTCSKEFDSNKSGIKFQLKEEKSKQKSIENDYKNIGLLYLKVNNLGDVMLHNCAKAIISDTLTKCDIKANINSIDMGDNDINKYHNKSLFSRIKGKIFRTLIKIFPNNRFIVINNWRSSSEYRKIINYTINEVFKQDAIIFAGGGLIKYHKQSFYLLLNEITKYCDMNNIPVMLNAVGVEGYNSKDVRCKILKKAINRSCVKIITTRDDIKLLNEKYITNKNIKTDLVANPALYLKETYNYREFYKKGKIGLGVIRPDIYKEYFHDVSEEFLLKLYSDLIKLCNKNNVNYELFTNGAKSDYRFILSLKEYMNNPDRFMDNVSYLPTDPYDLMSIIGSYKVFLGCRLHSSICGCALNVPNVNMVWNNKQIMFGKIYDLERNYITKDKFDAKFIFKRLMEESENRVKIDKTYLDYTIKYITDFIANNL